MNAGGNYREERLSYASVDVQLIGKPELNAYGDKYREAEEEKREDKIKVRRSKREKGIVRAHAHARAPAHAQTSIDIRVNYGAVNLSTELVKQIWSSQCRAVRETRREVEVHTRGRSTGLVLTEKAR